MKNKILKFKGDNYNLILEFTHKNGNKIVLIEKLYYNSDFTSALEDDDRFYILWGNSYNSGYNNLGISRFLDITNERRFIKKEAIQEFLKISNNLDKTSFLKK